MDATVQNIKNLLISSLQSLPDNIPAWKDNTKSTLTSSSIVEKRQSALARITETEKQYGLFDGRKVIALVGNVNAGKSSLGNFLLNKGVSEIFTENEIMETAQAKVAEFNENILIDLPGLGSVLGEKDDKTVSRYIIRADLLVIVQSLTNDIDKNLYDFLRKDVANCQKNGQRIVIVLNKIDNFHPVSLDKILERYQKFLLDGDPQKGFSGIRSLFTYNIPIIPFSLELARVGEFSDKALRDAISEALPQMENIDKSKKFQAEVIAIKNDWADVLALYTEINGIAIGKLLQIENKRKELLAEIKTKKILEAHISQLNDLLNQYFNSLDQEIKRLPGPTILQKAYKYAFDEGDGYKQRKNAFRDLGDSTIRLMKAKYREQIGARTKATENIINQHYKDAKTSLKAENIIDKLLTSYINFVDFTVKSYVDDRFEGIKLNAYRASTYRKNINAGYADTLTSYQKGVNTSIDTAHDQGLETYRQLERMAKILRPFFDYHKEIDLLIEKGEKPQVQHQQVSYKPYEKEKKSGLSTGTVILIVFAVLVFLLILIASSKN